MIKIICVGKKHEAMYQPTIDHFEGRIKPYSRIVWHILPHSSAEGTEARREESRRILLACKEKDYVILLDEVGTLATSSDIAHHINNAQSSALNICIIIGGAYGVDESVKNRAQTTIAFGRTVFPHQLVRVMVLEQVYRAYSILAGGKYHHE